MARAFHLALLLIISSKRADACSLCSPQRAGDGPIFELTTDSIDAAAERHDLLVLLLYHEGETSSSTVKGMFAKAAGRLKQALADPYLDPTLLDPSLRVSMSTVVTDERHSLMLAQIDASAHPLAAARLGVLSVELPALRVLRGDANFGYKLRGPAADFVVRTGRAVLHELNAPRRVTVATLPQQPQEGGRPTGALHVVATLGQRQGICAVEQVGPAGWAGSPCAQSLPPQCPSHPSASVAWRDRQSVFWLLRGRWPTPSVSRRRCLHGPPSSSASAQPRRSPLPLVTSPLSSPAPPSRPPPRQSRRFRNLAHLRRFRRQLRLPPRHRRASPLP